MMDATTNFAEDLCGAWHPTDCFVQVIDDPSDAAAAVTELRTRAIAAEDILLLTGAEFVDLIEQMRRRSGLVKRLLATAASGSAETTAQEMYLQECQVGHCIIAVRIGSPDLEQASRDDRLLTVADVTAMYRAHSATYYGAPALRDLLVPSAGPDALGMQSPVDD